MLCAMIIAQETVYKPEMKRYCDFAIATSADDAAAAAVPQFEEIHDLYVHLNTIREEQIIDSTVLSWSDDMLMNIFTVCARKYGTPVSMSELTSEYFTNQAVYDNLPVEKANLNTSTEQPAGPEITPITPDTTESHG